MISQGVSQCCRYLAQLMLSLVDNAGVVGVYLGWCYEWLKLLVLYEVGMATVLGADKVDATSSAWGWRCLFWMALVLLVCMGYGVWMAVAVWVDIAGFAWYWYSFCCMVLVILVLHGIGMTGAAWFWCYWCCIVLSWLVLHGIVMTDAARFWCG